MGVLPWGCYDDCCLCLHHTAGQLWQLGPTVDIDEEALQCSKENEVCVFRDVCCKCVYLEECARDSVCGCM